MIHVDFGNVLLKPSQRKQLMASLRRAIRLGQRVGNFAMNVTLRRQGKMVEMTAAVSDRAGAFACRSRRHTFKEAARELAGSIVAWVHNQRLARPATLAA
jgi:hypothetical protein